MTKIKEKYWGRKFPIEYVNYEGKKILILNRVKGFILAHECPFCGFNHSFPRGEGFRKCVCFPIDKHTKVPLTDPDSLKTYATDSTVLYARDGYFIKEYGRGN